MGEGGMLGPVPEGITTADEGETGEGGMLGPVPEGINTTAPAAVTSEPAAAQMPKLHEGNATAAGEAAAPAAITSEPAATQMPKPLEGNASAAPAGNKDCWFACGGK